MAREIDSFHIVALEPVKWWKLKVSKRQIVTVSTLRSSLQWVASLFSDRLKKSLRAAASSLFESWDPKSSEERIAMEKINRLVYSPDSWLYGAVKGLQNPPTTKLLSGGWIESSIRPHEEKGRYYNFPKERIWGQLAKTLYLLFPGTFAAPTKEDLKSWHRVDWKPCDRSIEPKVTWLGHSSVLIQIAGMNLIFDPTFDFVRPCFVRHTEPPIPLEKLPLIDLVCISHNHADHFDKTALNHFTAYKTAALVPHRLDSWFKKAGYESAEGKRWWQQAVLVREDRQITLTAVPAQHGSNTNIADLNRTLWMGVMIESEGYKIYFAGDTGYNPEIFEEISKKFGTIDLALLPVAPPEGKCEMHFDNHRALDAFEKLQAKRMVPIHYGAYRTGKEKVEDPLIDVTNSAKQRGLLDKITFLKIGETLELERQLQSSPLPKNRRF